MGSTETGRAVSGRDLIRNPAGATLAVVALTALALGCLRWVTVSGADGKAGERLVDSGPFLAWTAFAAIAVVLFADVLRDGVGELRQEPLAGSTPSPRFFAVYFAAFAAAAITALLLVGKGGPDVPIERWGAITGTLLGWGAVAAAPWVIAVWSTHTLLQDSKAALARLRPVTEDGAVPDLDEEFRRLRTYRAVIVRAVARLLSLVLAAVLMSGALRTALIEGKVITEEEFPASAVLLYGAFFTLVLATAVLPLMGRWRALARHLVERAYPHHVDDSADVVAARQRLLTALDVNGSLFTFPVTLSALLAPLVTSLLSVYVPQLGK